MKTITQLLALILLLTLASCDKEETLSLNLGGTWESRFLKGDPNNDVYVFSGNAFQRTINMKPAGSGTYVISNITDKDKNSGVVYSYRITFTIDGSKLGTFLKTDGTSIVMSSGQAGVDETHFVYDKMK